MATSYWAHNFAAQEGDSKDLPEDVKNMLLGIRQYQMHSYKRSALPLDTIWQEGEVTIEAVQGHDYSSGNEAIILVPSLINRAYVFDLNDERSLLRWLAAQGFNPYLLSWGEPVQDDGQTDMDGVVLKRLVPALRFMAQHEGRPVHALGYCMGGTLLTAAATRSNEVLKSVILLAAPWDFHGGTQALLNRVQFWAPSAFPSIDEKGVLGVDWIQTVFASLDPAMAMRKFGKFADMEKDGAQAELFVAVEDWLNDGVDLPGAVAQHCIANWFIKNDPVNGRWVLGGQPVEPSDINVPVLIIASDKDRLVEYETANVLADEIGRCTVVNPSCGHIGMIAGRHSVANVWQPLANWLQS
jgi:polyhydroxyalkanoate synthase